MTKPFLLYGSYGYTGSLIAELAIQRGLQPILSGRDPGRLKAQADILGLEYRPISLGDPGVLDLTLKDVPMVLNCAGPFVHTYKPVVDACLRMGRHYLDITGEIPIFEALSTCDNEAQQAGVMLLPGVGFDVVPSDCLAAHLKQRLPTASLLTLAIQMAGGGSSRGTALSAIEGIPRQGAVRLDGRLVQVPIFSKAIRVDFGRGPQAALSIPWGDISTAYYSTGIPNIETYMVFPKSLIHLVQILRPFIGLAGSQFVRKLLRQLLMKSPQGPTAEARRLSRSWLWGQARNDHGMQVISRMETPNGYDLTAQTALAVVGRVLAGDFKPGFQTPSLAYGADFILDFAGVHREDIELS